MERWKDIKGTCYSISDNGNVRSNKRVIQRMNNTTHSVQSRILKPSTDKKGYVRVALSINKNLKTFKVHRLVANAFILNDSDKPQVNHIDGNKQNNKINNLEWVTNKENIVHAYKNGLITPVSGEMHYNSKLTLKIINEAHQLKNEGLSYALIAKKFNVNKSTIMRALKGETWKEQ